MIVLTNIFLLISANKSHNHRHQKSFEKQIKTGVIKDRDGFMLITGKEYTRDEIHNQLGGSKQTYLPTKNGEVVAACLKKELNPSAPNVILVGKGPLIKSAGLLLSTQKKPVPVFLKKAVNRWEYEGQYIVKKSYFSEEDCKPYLSGSGRSDVSMVIILENINND